MVISIRQLQLLELEIAKEIKRICEKHSIRYYLEGGSLLGAIRHQGFIPWDDDMDIGMDYFDYKRFEIIAPHEIDHRFTIINWDKDSTYPHPYMKVCLKNSVAVEEAARNVFPKPHIWVDIFPYIGLGEKSIIKSRVLWGKILRELMLNACGYENSNVGMKSYALRSIGKMLGRETIKRHYERYIDVIQNVESDVISPLDDIVTGEYVFKREYLDNPVEMKFENELFTCPGGYKEILCNYYGDYMKIPPETERNKGHSLITCEIFASYEDYFR